MTGNGWLRNVQAVGQLTAAQSGPGVVNEDLRQFAHAHLHRRNADRARDCGLIDKLPIALDGTMHLATDAVARDRDAPELDIGHLIACRRRGYEIAARLQGHTVMTSTPGVEMSAGSLGQGLSFGIGVALAGRLNSLDYRVYILLGDGECDEGQVWEAAMTAAHFKLDHVIAIIDHNEQQIAISARPRGRFSLKL